MVVKSMTRVAHIDCCGWTEDLILALGMRLALGGLQEEVISELDLEGVGQIGAMELEITSLT